MFLPKTKLSEVGVFKGGGTWSWQIWIKEAAKVSNTTDFWLWLCGWKSLLSKAFWIGGNARYLRQIRVRESRCYQAFIWVRSVFSPLLTAEEEVVFFLDLLLGDEKARKRMIVTTCRLCEISRSLLNIEAVSLLDLIEEGNLWLNSTR